jgi:hypothetical protein
MIELLVENPENVTVNGEGNWLSVRRPEPTLAKATPADLLARTADLPGNFRYATAPSGGVALLGEVAQEGIGIEADKGLLSGHPATDGGARALGEGSIEAALDAAGLTWTRRESAWVVPPTDWVPQELQVTTVPGGVRVEALLVDGEGLEETERMALAHFLTAAQAWLCWARCELDARGARVVALVETGAVDGGLVHSVLGAAAGCRLLAREARALTDPETARQYQDFHGA